MRHKYPRPEPEPEPVKASTRRPDTLGSYWFKIILLVGFAILFGLLTWNLMKDYRTGWESQNWPSVKGKIESLDLQEIRGTIVAIRGYRVVVEYGYVVKGVSYIGRKWMIDTNRMYPEDYQTVRKTLKAGSDFDVYYQPEDPSLAVLNRGSRTGALDLIFSIGSMILFAILALLMTYKMIRQKQPRGAWV